MGNFDAEIRKAIADRVRGRHGKRGNVIADQLMSHADEDAQREANAAAMERGRYKTDEHGNLSIKPQYLDDTPPHERFDDGPSSEQQRRTFLQNNDQTTIRELIPDNTWPHSSNRTIIYDPYEINKIIEQMLSGVPVQEDI